MTPPNQSDNRADPAGEPGPAPRVDRLPIVAIGASAGGLEATSRLFDALPDCTDMAFIVVQHLDPVHKSMMVELLATHTAMAVMEASDGDMLAPDIVHVIPPGCYLTVSAGMLHVTAHDARQGARLPFDRLLASLAQTCGPQTIAVVLSGTGSDGSAALPALKQAGGHALAQAPDQAEYPGMPHAAIATGMVDRILKLADMPAALADFVARMASPGPRTAAPLRAQSADINAILTYLRDRTGHDFLPYKPGTMARRIARRMGLLALGAGDLAGYLDRLRFDPGECDLLASDLLINVTRFFRDPKVFDALETTILPDIIRDLAAGQSLRVWAAGCSTGEEAYSLAMVCADAIARSGREVKLQIFASDIDIDAIGFAREGFYPPAIADHITPDRLARHFVVEEGGIRVNATLRGQIVFSVQDVLVDPPFSRINLVTCRNLLIYLNAQAQAKVLTIFHFALREGGILMLGTSEAVGKAEGRFDPVPGVDCCYRHVASSHSGESGFPFTVTGRLPVLSNTGPTAEQAPRASLAEICKAAVLAGHAPAAVLINQRHECLFSIGPTSRFLRLAPGYATLDLLAMATPGLRTRLRLAINRVVRGESRVDGGRSRLTVEGQSIWFTVTVERVAQGDGLMLVCFAQERVPPSRSRADRSPATAARIAELERELEETQADLHASVQQREITDQEQKAINEEALSVNEEFQSTNEELLTSKEELQSLNEELTALNSQLQETLDRQRLASDDLQNVLYSTKVGTMFLDTDLHIRFFTPAIRPLFNAIASDIGRPLADLRPVADDPELLADARQVLATGTTIERDVQAPEDVWFLRRIFPYRAHDSRVQGVVITFADITDRKLSTAAMEFARRQAERANLAKSRFLAAASHDLRQPLQVLMLLKDQLARALEEGPPNTRAANLFGRFDETLSGLSGMLDVLLNINQIEVGAITPQRGPFAVNDMLDSLRDEFTPLALARNLSLVVLPCPASIDTDRRLLQQIVRNLLGNAVKYTRQGRVVLACRRRGANLRIEVRDTGIGIEQGQLRAIFEEFHQIDNPTRASAQGLGLGLAIVERLGHLLGHAIDVTSRPGKGSVFAVTVPCCADAPVGPRAPQPDPAAPLQVPGADDPARARLSIMLVEDDPDLLDLLAQLLRRQGHSVLCAATFDAAVEHVTRGALRPDLVLTDYNLPAGRSGVELLKVLRDKLGTDLPAIILTGDISTQAVAAIKDMGNGADGTPGACLHLSKPVESVALMRAIDQLVAKGTDVEAPALRPAGDDVVADDPGRMTCIIDDERAVRDAVLELLSGQGLPAQGFDSAEAFCAVYRPGLASCLLLDVRLPGMSGIDLLRQLRASGDHVPVILITGEGDVGLAVEAMRAGASEFIEKPVASAELLASIDRATAQSRDLRHSDELRDEALRSVRGLTARQRQVMTMVLAGQPSKNIAADLGISQRTVENHRAEIMRRMGARSIPELARKVLIAEL